MRPFDLPHPLEMTRLSESVVDLFSVRKNLSCVLAAVVTAIRKTFRTIFQLNSLLLINTKMYLNEKTYSLYSSSK